MRSTVEPTARPTAHWPRAAERRAIAGRAERRAVGTRSAVVREARPARRAVRERAAPVAFTFLGLAVVAATGTADAPIGSLQALPEPARPSVTGPPLAPAAPVTTTVPTFATDPTTYAAGPFVDAPVGVRPAAMATALPDERARTAVRVAMSQIGLPYVWGGDGPEAGDRGFDCSGLTHFAYDEAGVDLPRTAHTQFRAGPRVPDGAPLHPGDLVFYGTYRKVHHVGMYIGGGRMVNAPTFGKPVQTAWYRWRGDDYIGASRPASSTRGSAPLADVPPVPDPTVPSPDEFVAPAAPRPPVVPEPRAPQPPEPDSATQSRTGSDADVAAGRVPAPRPALVVPQVPATASVTAAGPPTVSGTATPSPSPGQVPGPSVPSGTAAVPSPAPVTAAVPPLPTGSSAVPGTPTPSGTPAPVPGGGTGPAAASVPPPSTSAGGVTPRVTPTTAAAASPVPSSVPRTSPPATSPPAASAPTTPAPTTSAPATSASPGPSSSAGPGPQPVAPTPPSPTPSRTGAAPTSAAMTVGDERRPIRLVDAGPDGYPTVPGIARGQRGWVARLGEPLTAGAGTPVTVTLPDGRTLRWTVESRSAPGPRDAMTSPDAPLVLLAPTTDGLWTTLTAR